MRTALLTELRAGVNPNDPRGVWAMSGAGSSAVFAHGYIGDANGPNAPSVGADDIANCGQIGDRETLAAMGMPCCCERSPSPPNWQAAPRGLHPNGVFCAFADGSVHFISDFVQLGIRFSNLGVWDRLNLSIDGNMIDGSTF